MTSWDDFLPFIAPSVISCPRDTVMFHARMAAIRFCRKAHVWREDLDTLLADGLSTEFALALDDQVEIAKLLRVQIAQGADTQYSEVRVVDAYEGHEAQRSGCTEVIAWTDNRRSLHVSPMPRHDARIQVYAALKPSMSSFSFSDEVFAHYAHEIAKGATASLLAMPKCDWTEPMQAEQLRREFNEAINTAARASNRGFARRARNPSTRFY